MKSMRLISLAVLLVSLGAALDAAAVKLGARQLVVPDAKLAIHKPNPAFHFMPPSETAASYLLRTGRRGPTPVQVGPVQTAGCTAVQSGSADIPRYVVQGSDFSAYQTYPMGALFFDAPGSIQTTFNVPTGATSGVVQVTGETIGPAVSASLGLEGTSTGASTLSFANQPAGNFTLSFAADVTGCPQLNSTLTVTPVTKSGQIRIYTITATFYK